MREFADRLRAAELVLVRECSVQAAAHELGVARLTIYRWLAGVANGGQPAVPLRPGPRPVLRPHRAANIEALREHVRRAPAGKCTTGYLDQLWERLDGDRYKPSTLEVYLRRWGCERVTDRRRRPDKHPSYWRLSARTKFADAAELIAPAWIETRKRRLLETLASPPMMSSRGWSVDALLDKMPTLRREMVEQGLSREGLVYWLVKWGARIAL